MFQPRPLSYRVNSPRTPKFQTSRHTQDVVVTVDPLDYVQGSWFEIKGVNVTPITWVKTSE